MPRNNPRRAALRAAGAVCWSVIPTPLQESPRAQVERERAEFAAWVESAPLSPRRAVAVLAVGQGLVLGGESGDVAIAGTAQHRLEERGGRLTLTGPDGGRPVRRGAPFTVGAFRLVVAGTAGRSTLTAFAPEHRGGKAPVWYTYDPRWVFRVNLVPPRESGTRRLLAPEGVEVDASEAGTATFTLNGTRQTLRVMRMPGGSEDETELEVYFRDSTNGQDTYPSGRFISLVPDRGAYRLDLNRARNPFCAYNTAYPCPAPWRGNQLRIAVPAGERYAGGGLEVPGGAPRPPTR